MYIHETENWTNFTWDNEIILPKLASVRYLQGKLLGRMEHIGFELTEKATLESLLLDVVDSSKIEGEFLNPELVRSSIAKKLGIENIESESVSRDIEGIVDVLLDVTQNYEKPLTEERLFGWHNSLFQSGFSGLVKIDVARYRSAGMKIISGAFGREKIHYEAPHEDRVKLEMDKLLSWINENNNIDSVLKAFIAHLWFVTIHPFDDGNGRLARAIMDFLLTRSDGSKNRFYSMSNQLFLEHKHYNNIIEKTQKGDSNITEYLLWFIECFERALLSSDKNLEIILDKSKFWDIHREMLINERQRMIINFFYDNYGKSFEFLRTKVYAQLAQCSTDTALRDLQDLVGKGMLTVEDSGKKTNYLINSPSKLTIPKVAKNSTCT